MVALEVGVGRLHLDAELQQAEGGDHPLDALGVHLQGNRDLELVLAEGDEVHLGQAEAVDARLEHLERLIDDLRRALARVDAVLAARLVYVEREADGAAAL